MISNENQSKLHVFQNRLNDSACMSGTCFAPSKYKVLLGDWIDLRSNGVLAEEQLSGVDRFSFLVSFSSPAGRISDEMSSRV